MTCGQEFADAPDKCPFDGTLLSVIATELLPGAVLGDRYEIIGAVASGGMGQIYKAKHRLMNRVVAIKTIHLSLVSSGAALQRFQQEAQAISTLNHPNILTVFDFFISDDGQPYLVMDYLQGTNLQEVLKAQPRMDLVRALPILIEACSGFAHAHEHGVIHRDIKPANLMLVNFAGNPDFVKIVDFGIAKLVPEEGETRHLTATGDTFGSPEYMSPEQCRAKKPDARSDIYSLGCVMYVMLTGVSPFGSQDPMEIMYKQVHDAPPPPSKICPEANLSEAMDELILKAIQKEPDERFQSMDAMRIALESISAQMGGTVGQRASDARPVTSNGPQFANSGRSQSAVTAGSELGVSGESTSAVAGRAASAVAGGSTAADLNDVTRVSTTADLTDVTKVSTAVTTKSAAVKNQSIAAFAAIGIAAVAVIIIVIAVRNQNQISPGSSQTTAAGANQAGAPTAANVALSPQALAENAKLQRLQQAESSYNSNFKSGEAEFSARHFAEARLFFRAAHSASETFGQHDERYISSLYWVSKCNLSTGRYEQALQGLQWVLYAQKMHYGPKSPEVRTTERDLQTAERALKR